jgi:histone H3/H4
MLNRVVIRKLLSHLHPQIYPSIRISKLAVDCIINIFEKFKNMTETDIIEHLNGALREQAILRKNGFDGVTNYIVSEILELSEHVAQNSHRKTIHEFDIWISIVNDFELLPVNFPINHIRKPTSLIILHQFHDNGLTLSAEAKILVRNILMLSVVEYPHDLSKSQLRLVTNENYVKIIDIISNLIIRKFGNIKVIYFHHLNEIFPNNEILLRDA